MASPKLVRYEHVATHFPEGYHHYVESEGHEIDVFAIRQDPTQYEQPYWVYVIVQPAGGDPWLYVPDVTSDGKSVETVIRMALTAYFGRDRQEATKPKALKGRTRFDLIQRREDE